MRIDGEAEPDAKLSNIGDIEFAANDEVFVLETLLHAVLVYDTTGTRVRRFGGRGGGPGEFVGPRFMAIASDTVYVASNQDVNRLKTTGGFIDRFSIDNQVKLGAVTASAGTNMIAHTPAGLLGYFVTLGQTTTGVGVAPNADVMLLQRIDKGTGRVSTILEVEQPEEYSDGPLHPHAWLVFEPRIAVGRDGNIFIARPGGTSIDVFDMNGAPLRRITFAPDRRKVTDDDVSQWLQRSDSAWRSPRGSRLGFDRKEHAARMRFMATLPRAELYPVIDRIIAASDGGLLVERADLSEGSGRWNGPAGPTTWDLISSDGEIVGRTELPPRFKPSAMKGSLVAGTFLDDNDVPSIIVYRLH